MKKLKFISILFVMILILTSCGSQSVDKQTSENDNVVVKDQVVIANAAELSSGWNPLLGWGNHYNPLIQSKLLKMEEGEITYDLATSYNANEDCTIWNFELRDDVKFSDGEPFTAKDVVFTIEQCQKEESSMDYSIVKEVKILNDYSIEMILNEPRSTFAYQMTKLAMVPEHAYGPDYNENPIGCGPYVLAQWDKGQQAIFTENPYYYGKKSEIKKIVMLFMEQTAALTAIQTGQADIAYADMATAEVEVPGYELKKYESADNIGISFVDVPYRGENEFDKVVGNDITSDVNVRKALCIACDRDKFANDVLSGYATPSFGLACGLPWYNKEIAFEDGNIEKANSILENSGWIDTDGDGIREKDGVKATFTLLYPSNNELRQLVATAFSEVASNIGIEVILNGASWDVIMNDWHKDCFVLGAGNLTPFELYQSVNAESAGISYGNQGYYSNDKVEEYLDAAMKESDMKKATNYWKLAQWDGETGCSMLGDAPVCWLLDINHMFFIKNGLYTGEAFVQEHGDYGMQLFDKVQDWHWE